MIYVCLGYGIKNVQFMISRSTPTTCLRIPSPWSPLVISSRAAILLPLTRFNPMFLEFHLKSSLKNYVRPYIYPFGF